MSSEKSDPPMYQPPQAGYPPPGGQPPPPAYPGPEPAAGQPYPPVAQPYPPTGQPYPPAGQPYPPPQQAPIQGQPQVVHAAAPAATVVVTQANVGARPGSVIRYNQSPALIVCQHCQATVTTSMDYEVGLLTWLVVGGLCLIGCWLGCCLIPLCIDPLKDIQHKCPNCKNTVGRFRHFS